MKSKSLNIILAITCGILLTYILLGKCKTELDVDKAIAFYKESHHAINIEKSKSLYNNYKDRFIEPIKKLQEGKLILRDTEENISFNNKQIEFAKKIKRKNYHPTEYAWVSVEWVEKYLNFIKALEKKNPEYEISGIAINFGAYNLDYKNNSINKKNKTNGPEKIGDSRGRLTTFFSPTFFNGKDESDRKNIENHIPFCIKKENSNDPFKGTYISLREVHEGKEPTASFYKPKKTIFKASILPSFSSIIAEDNYQDIDYTSVSANEFTDMPPKKPKGNQDN